MRKRIAFALFALFAPMLIMGAYIRNKDPWLEIAIQQIEADYGDTVSVEAKDKSLLKFGRNTNVGTSAATLMDLDGTEVGETYVSTNAITHVISTSAADGEEIKIEGHTISGTDLTFVVQTATLNGQTAVALGTALARCTRLLNNDSTELAGKVSAYEGGTTTAGDVDTDSEIHCIIPAGQQQSRKASTSISSVDYWIVTGKRQT